MAQTLASEMLGPGVDARSAGIETASGMRAAKDAVEAMKEIDLDITEHRTTEIEEIDLADYDQVVAMTFEIGSRLLDHFQVEEDKLIIWDIPDPFGKGIEEYRSTIRALKQQIGDDLADFDKGE